MSATGLGGYIGMILRVDLTSGQLSEEKITDEVTLSKFIGGSGIGIKYLYDEVPPGIEWSDAENRLIFASGPLGGTIGGTGTFAVVTKGPMTNGAVSAQANGFMGAFMKQSGFDAIIVQGLAKEPVYLYLHDGIAELRDANHLAGKDTWETEDLIRRQLGKSGRQQLSVQSIGPAGENLVRFAAIVGDHGHVAAHGGAGAVMGSKRLKAIVAARSNKTSLVRNKAKLNAVAKSILEAVKVVPLDLYHWGTSTIMPIAEQMGWLPVKNYTTTVFPGHDKLVGSYYRERFDIKRSPCWACGFKHCHIVKVTEGPYTGFVGEEPEYEGGAMWGSLIDQRDPGAVVVINNEVDRFGMDINESGWIIAWLMECYERGILTKNETDGIEMKWGNVEAVRTMLRKIAYRDGLGDLLAEGAMRAATRIGGEASNCAVYTKKGNTPRGHDDRPHWTMLLDVSTSSMGTDEASLVIETPDHLGLAADTDPFTPEGAAAMLASGNWKLPFLDSLLVCKLSVLGCRDEDIVEALNAVTGWNFSTEEAKQAGRRIINLFRAFNVRHGLTPELDMPSPRYGSAPIDGPAKGKTILPVWNQARRCYYELMGWDAETGKPLADTLRRFGLEDTVKHIWP